MNSTEKLISLVQSLLNTSDRNYKNSLKKEMIWERFPRGQIKNQTRLDIEELPVTTPLLMNTVVQGEQSNGYSKSHEPTQNFSKNHSEVNTPSTTSNANNTEFLEPRQLSNSRLHKLNTKLLEAIKSSDTEEIKRLLGGGAKANATCCLTFISASHLAVLSGGDALAILLKNGAEKHERDKQGITPLHVAALAGNARHMAMLLDFPEEVQNSIENDNIDMTKIKEKLCPITKKFVNIQVDTEEVKISLLNTWMDNGEQNCHDIIDSFSHIQQGWTPLHVACASAQLHCAKVLLAAGANPNITDDKGRTPLDVAGFAYYCSDANINIINLKNFTEVIKMLLEAGGQFNTMKAEGVNNVNTPLHTAVELDSQDTITELLNSGASITCLNEAGQTPLHVCILNKLEESLKMLVNYVDPLPKTIDVKNSDNRTILDVAVTEAWMPGVCIALKAGADITLKANNNETLLHVAAKIGNMCILKEIVSATEQGNNQNLYKAIYHELLVPTKENVLHVAAENGHTEILNYLLQCTSSFINNINGKGETALIKATINGHLDCVKLLLTNGADIKITTKEKVNVFHVAAENGHLEILKYLLEQKLKEEELLLNTLTESKNGSFGPIHFAVSNNHGDCVKLLLKKGADVNLSTGKHGPYSLWTPLHIAVYKNNIDVAEILLQNEQIRINEENEEYWSPLHLALHLDVRDILPLLLRNGADLSSAIPFDPVKGEIALHFMLRKNSPESVDFMEEIFDSCISTNTGNDPNCEITLDYRILTSTRESNQVNVLQELLNTNNTYVQKKLLAHPLVESFIYLKWKALLPFSCTIIAMYVLFVISMTILAGSHSYHDVTERPIWLNPLIWTSIILCSLYFMYAQVAISHFTNPHREILFREIPIVRLVIFLLVPILMYNFVVTPHMSAGKDFLVELLRDVTAFALPLSYVALMMLCSKFMKWGYYIHMYSIVAFNVLKIFLIFAYLIFTFAISFMIQFNGQEPFENLWTAFLKTIVMMTSEFDYDDAFVQKKFSHIFFLTISRIFFVMFVIFIVIVLMNIMIGVAVNDINDLKALGNIRRIVDEADFLSDLDVEINTIIKILPRKVNSFVRNRCKVQTTLKLNPGNPEYQQNNLLPSHLRDAILHKTLTPKERR